jgi:hypothetical protein
MLKPTTSEISVLRNNTVYFLLCYFLRRLGFIPIGYRKVHGKYRMEQDYTNIKCGTLFQSIAFPSFVLNTSWRWFLSTLYSCGKKRHHKTSVSHFCCRCRIPECEGTEATFYPDWLQNAVPFHQHGARYVPRRCLRFASRNLSLLGDDTEGNVSSCSPESFDNRSFVRCDEWVYAEEETTILREVR